MNAKTASPICPVCGAVLRDGASADWCPACAWRDLAETGLTSADPTDADALFSVDGHDILAELARGGGGIVYRAIQYAPRREVALKILPPHEIDSPEMLARFRAEAETVAALDHPAILPVYAVGEYEGMPYFTMKMAGGGTLASRREKLRGSWREIAELIVTIADAVHYAHTHGVIHRDLKPGNVLFDDTGRPYVSDFGIAKFTDATAPMTRTLAILGTPAYVAPEIARNGAGFATIASDVYGLGTMLFELLTGRPPFEARALPELMRQVIEQPPVEPATLTPAVPRDLSVICLRCLAKAPAERFATAAEVADDIRRWLEGRPIESRAAGRVERVQRWVRRHPSTAIFSLTLGLTLLTSAIVLLWQNLHLRDALARATAAENSAQEQLHTSLVNEARQLRQTARVRARADALETLERAGAIRKSPGLRTELIATLARPSLVTRHVVPVILPTRNTTVSVAADFSSYLIPDPEAGFVQLETGSESLIRRFRSSRPEQALYLQFASADRAILASYPDRTTEVWDVDGDAPWWSISGEDVPTVKHEGYTRREPVVAMHPEGLGLAYVSADRSIRWVQRESGAERTIIPPTENIYELSFSPAGDLLLVVRASVCSAYTWPAATLLWERAEDFSVCEPGWQRDGRRVAIGLIGGNDVLLCDAETGRDATFLSGHTLHPRMLQFDANGNRLFSIAWDNLLIGWDTRTDSVEIITTAYPSVLKISSDGRRLAYGSSASALTIATLEPGPFFAELAGDEDTHRITCDLALSPDGQWAVSVDHLRLSLWSVSDARMVWREPTQPNEMAGVAFDPEGTAVLQSGERTGIFRRAMEFDATGKAIGLGPAEPVAPGHPGLLRGVDDATGDWWVEVSETRRLSRWPRGVPEQAVDVVPIDVWARAGVSSDGRFVAVDDGAGHITVRESDTGARVATLPTAGPAAVRFSPDGRWLLACTRDDYRLWDISTWQPGPSWPAMVDTFSGTFCYSPDGSLVASRHGGSGIELRDTSSYELLLRLEPPTPLRPEHIKWSADGSSIFLLCTGHRLARWDLASVRRELARRSMDW